MKTRLWTPQTKAWFSYKTGCLVMCVHVYIYICMYVGMYVCMYGPGIFPVAEGENGHRRMDMMRSALLSCDVPSGYLT